MYLSNLTLPPIMENKQNQPSNGSAQNGSSNSKSASSQQPVNAEVNSDSIPATSASTADSSRAPRPSGSRGKATSTAETSDQASGQESQSGQQGQQKSWLDQQQWLKNIDVNQLPQQLKDISSKAAEQVNKLTPTQKVIGGAILVSGLSWLALRSKSNSSKGEIYQPYRGAKDSSSKWNSSNESVYRGASQGYADDDYASDL